MRNKEYFQQESEELRKELNKALEIIRMYEELFIAILSNKHMTSDDKN